MANPHRGEVRIELARLDGGEPEELALRPTIGAIVEVEEKLGLGLAGVIQRFSRPPVSYGVRDVLAIVTAGLKAAGHKERPDVVAERVAETGLERLVTPCVQFCGNAWLGGQDPLTPSEMTEPTAPTASSPPGNGSDMPVAN